MLLWESNFDEKHFSNKVFWVKEMCYRKKIANVFEGKLFWKENILDSKNSRIDRNLTDK